MKYTDRKNYTYDPDIFRRGDTQTALKIHHEYVVKHSGRPHPKFFEVDRGVGTVDPVWNSPIGGAVKYSRTFELPSIIQFEKLDWKLMRQGRPARQRCKLWISNIGLQNVDYFPVPGDKVYHSGYLTEVVAIDFEQSSYWQQTNVWLGLIVVTEIVPDGDTQPLIDPSTVPPSQVSNRGLVEVGSSPGSLPSAQNGADISGIMPASVESSRAPNYAGSESTPGCQTKKKETHLSPSIDPATGVPTKNLGAPTSYVGEVGELWTDSAGAVFRMTTHGWVQIQPATCLSAPTVGPNGLTPTNYLIIMPNKRWAQFYWDGTDWQPVNLQP